MVVYKRGRETEPYGSREDAMKVDPIYAYALDGHLEDCQGNHLGTYRVISRWRVGSRYMGWYTWHAIRARIRGLDGEMWARYNVDNGSAVALRPVRS
jgi:hypothetical protein